MIRACTLQPRLPSILIHSAPARRVLETVSLGSSGSDTCVFQESRVGVCSLLGGGGGQVAMTLMVAFHMAVGPIIWSPHLPYYGVYGVYGTAIYGGSRTGCGAAEVSGSGYGTASVPYRTGRNRSVTATPPTGDQVVSSWRGHVYHVHSPPGAQLHVSWNPPERANGLSVWPAHLEAGWVRQLGTRCTPT